MSLIKTYESLLRFYPTEKDLQSIITAMEIWSALTTNGVYLFIAGMGCYYTRCGKTNMERVCL